jgi:hypothetical protein
LDQSGDKIQRPDPNRSLRENRREDSETKKERKVEKGAAQKNPEIKFHGPVAPLGEKIP